MTRHPRSDEDVSGALEGARPDRDAVLERFDAAELDDEPVTADEEAGAHEAWAEYERGESVPLDESPPRG